MSTLDTEHLNQFDAEGYEALLKRNPEIASTPVIFPENVKPPTRMAKNPHHHAVGESDASKKQLATVLLQVSTDDGFKDFAVGFAIASNKIVALSETLPTKKCNILVVQNGVSVGRFDSAKDSWKPTPESPISIVTVTMEHFTFTHRVELFRGDSDAACYDFGKAVQVPSARQHFYVLTAAMERCKLFTLEGPDAVVGRHILYTGLPVDCLPGSPIVDIDGHLIGIHQISHSLPNGQCYSAAIRWDGFLYETLGLRPAPKELSVLREFVLQAAPGISTKRPRSAK